MQIESSANTPGLNYRVEVFNFVNGVFEELDDRSATFNEDETISLNPPNDPQQYIQNGNAVTRVSWRSTGINLMFPWRASLDRITWSFDD